MIAIISFVTGMLLGCMCILTGYLLLITLAAYRAGTPSSGRAIPLRLGVLIPAHNESKGIEATVHAVHACTYPPENLRILVIADNCTDDTAERARTAGETVLERTDTVNRGKGQAISWFLEHHKNLYHDLDALTVIDADTLPDPLFLQEMASSLASPSIQAVQSYNGVANPGTNWRTGLIDAAFNVFNHLRMAGLYYLAGTCMLKGNGMGFSIGLLKKYGWPAHSVVEDMEFSMLLARDGIAVHYVPNAVIRSQMVSSGANAAPQRTRWEAGRFSVITTLLPGLLRSWSKKPEIPGLLVIMDLLFPPLSLHILALALVTLLSFLVLPSALALVSCMWLVVVFYVISGQIQRHAPLSTWLYLFTAPAFILWKIPLYLKALLRKKSSEWVRTTRE